MKKADFKCLKGNGPNAGIVTESVQSETSFDQNDGSHKLKFQNCIEYFDVFRSKMSNGGIFFQDTILYKFLLIEPSPCIFDQKSLLRKNINFILFSINTHVLLFPDGISTFGSNYKWINSKIFVNRCCYLRKHSLSERKVRSLN